MKINRSKEWFLKIDHSRSSRLSKTNRCPSLSNRSSSLYKHPKQFSSDDQQPIDKKYLKRHSPLYHHVTTKKSNSSFSSSSSSSSESSDDPSSFPPPPSVVKDILKTDMTSVYSVTDDQQDDIAINKNELSKPFHPDTPLLPSIKEKLKDEPNEKRARSTTNKTILKQPLASAAEQKESIRKSNVFTSSSHSMVDAGCGGHILSKIPALRCLRPNKQHHHTQKFQKISPLPPPPLVVR
jgi:hypothetical protein